MSDMPIKMCLRYPVLSSAPKQKHTLGSNLVSEPDSILKFRIVKSLGRSQNRNSDIPSLGTGTRNEMSRRQNGLSFFSKDPVDWKSQY